MDEHEYDNAGVPHRFRRTALGTEFLYRRRFEPSLEWGMFLFQAEAAGKTLPGGPWDPAPERTPEQQRAEWLEAHKHGDLSKSERELLSVGIAPALTPARFLKKHGRDALILGLVLALGLVVWSLGAVGVLVGVVVVLVLAVGVVGFEPLRRLRKEKRQRG
jgi:hypothetical protein